MKKEKAFKFKQGIFSSVSVLIVAGILIVLNVLAYRIFIRLDLTGGKLYSLSKATKKLIGKLDDPIIVKAYFSKNLPSPYSTNRQYIEDLLSEYKNYSKGKIKFNFIDPAEDEKTKTEALMMGISPIRFTQIESDKYEMKEGYMGLAFLYEDKKEIIPFVKETVSLEYDITSRIKKISQDKLKSLGFLSGNGEPDVFKDLSGLGQFLAQQYEVKNISFKENKDIPDLDALILLLPKEKLTDWEKYKIDQFLMIGKPVAFLLNRTDVDLQTFQAKAIDDNLDDLLAHYGVEIRKGIVLDDQCQMITVQTQQGFFSVQNMVKCLFFPLITSFAENNPIVKDLERVTLPFINPIKINEALSKQEKARDKGIDRFNSEVIARSSQNSWYYENLQNINPLNKYSPSPSDEKGPFDLAVILTGRFESFYLNKPIPEAPATNTSTDAAAIIKEEFIKQGVSTRMLVIGNAKFIDKDFLGDRASINFFLNIVDWLTQDDALISIRSKEIIYRPLKEISKGWRRTVKYIDIFLMPLLLVTFGIILWRIRRFRKASLNLN